MASMQVSKGMTTGRTGGSEWHRRLVPLAVTVWSVSCQTSGEPSKPTWSASLCRPGLNCVGWPRFVGAGKKAFESPIAMLTAEVSALR